MEDYQQKTAEIFNEQHENTKFRETGSVANKERNIENPIRNEAIEVGVLGQVYVDPTLSTRKLETVCGVSRRTVQRILKAHSFHPYKIHLVQEHNEDDFDRRLQFCEDMNAIDPALTAIIENQNDRRFQIDGLVEEVPDLSPLDFFMWGHLKSKIYATQTTSLEDLPQRIVNECLQITPHSSHESSVNYDRELDAILERYEEAAKNEDHYLLYTQFPNGSYQIGCGLSPARSFTPAVIVWNSSRLKLSFSSYEWEQLITQLNVVTVKETEEQEEEKNLPDKYDPVEIECGDYCRIRRLIYDSTKILEITKHNISFYLSEMDVNALLEANNELLVPYMSMLETVEFPSYYYNALKIVRASFNDQNYTFSDAIQKLYTFKLVGCTLQHIALGQHIFFYRHRIANDLERF
ncbi:unnamed protein product [Acanthoscelides obtectus]|uniref:Uncharacterized protein n=1 Tax=Acanthoscelides obtectus TaxID=200917 RepID=A0A9P0M609_ACAOB|nr:unnamed protein product [Acanthoscelides obtectus]CAK1638701.1 hypothetical protein AOBTE_LOCUS10768 [Acanthoscelides obtectus]